MSNLLQLNTSLFSNAGQSSALANQFVAAWREKNANAAVIVRDLAADPIPHLTAERFSSFLASPSERTTVQQEVVNFSDQLINELKSANVIVLGLPMYNFGVPSTLKAYFDHIARAGITFRYSDSGPIGLLNGKKVYVFATRGGLYAGTALDTQTTYVKDFWGFIGIDNVEFIYAEGLAMGESQKQIALIQAQQAIEQIKNTMEAKDFAVA